MNCPKNPYVLGGILLVIGILLSLVTSTWLGTAVAGIVIGMWYAHTHKEYIPKSVKARAAAVIAVFTVLMFLLLIAGSDSDVILADVVTNWIALAIALFTIVFPPALAYSGMSLGGKFVIGKKA